MTRIELYKKITPCGGIDYNTIVWVLNNLVYTDQQVGLFLTNKITQNGRMERSEWIMLFNAVTYIGSIVNADVATSWLTYKCAPSRDELKFFFEYANFHDNEPTFVTTSANDLITTNNY